MCAYATRDKIRNDEIGEKMGVAPVVYKMLEVRLRWLEHVHRRCERLDVVGLRRGRVRPKKSWRDVIRLDMT